MSKELDELLGSLLKEIPPNEEKKPPGPIRPTKEAFRQAERIVQDVEQDKSWQIPPERPKPTPPAPQHEPVIPETVSHFTNVPSTDPSIRMRDRLDETALPKPDIERKPTQIMDVRPPIFKRKKKKRKKQMKVRSKETSKPKRKIPHIVVPDELPPDIPREIPPRVEETDAEYQAALRSRLEQIKEQRRRKAEEAAAAQARQAPEKEDKLPPFEEAPSAEHSVEVALTEHNKPLREEAEAVTDWRTLAPFREEPELLTEPEPQEALIPEEPEIPSGAEPEELRILRPLQASEAAEELFFRHLSDPEPEREPVLRHLGEVEAEPEERPGLFGRFRRKKTEKADQQMIADFEEAAERFVEMTAPVSKEETAPPEELEAEKRPKASHGLAAALREALDETAEELAEIRAEPLPEQDAYPKTHFLRRHSYFLAGIVCFLLAVVGLVTCVRWCWDKVQGFAGSASLKQTLEDVLYPAAVVDLPAFEAPGELDAASLLTAAMVDILMYDDLSGYPESFGVISVPAADVLARAQRMFGTEFQPSFDTLHAAGETFFYDNEGGCYNVPTEPVIFSYSPEVTDIRRSGDTCTCTVVYHSDLAKWQERSGNYQDSSAKTMQVTLVKNGDTYQITRMANVQTGDGE